MSRCLAEIGVIKQELIDKTNLLHASQEMIDNLRTDAEKMRQEFSNYDQMITNTKYETEVMRIHSNYLVSHNSNKLPQPKNTGWVVDLVKWWLIQYQQISWSIDKQLYDHQMAI